MKILFWPTGGGPRDDGPGLPCLVMIFGVVFVAGLLFVGFLLIREGLKVR